MGQWDNGKKMKTWVAKDNEGSNRDDMQDQ